MTLTTAGKESQADDMELLIEKGQGVNAEAENGRAALTYQRIGILSWFWEMLILNDLFP